jgi:hypothetical protein
MGLGMQFMITVLPQVSGSGVGQVPPAQVPPELLHQPYSLTLTHW